MSTVSAEVFRLGHSSSIPPGEGRNFSLAETSIAVFRTRAGELFGTQVECPHRGAPLADGLVGGGRVVCPFHSYAFDLATGEPVLNGCPALRTYRVWADADGEMFVALNEDSDLQPCPRDG